MINLRYHIVSLVAVFLALGVGVIAGTTVVDQEVVRRLEEEQQALSSRAHTLENDLAARERELTLWERYGESVFVQQVRGRLQGRPVAIVVQSDVPAELVDDIEAAIEDAGGSAAGRIRFTDKWRFTSRPARDQLALALSMPDATAEDLLAEAGRRVGSRLTAPADASDRDDLLMALSRAGFLTLDDLGSGAFPRRNSLVVIVAAGEDTALPPASPFLDLMLERLADGVPTVVAEPLGVDDSFADRARGREEIVGRIGTIDHVDTAIGRLALIAALEAEAAGLEGRHYGMRRRAEAIAPGVASRS